MKTLVFALSAVAVMIVVALSVVSDRYADDVAIGKAMACLIAKHPVGYAAEVEARRLGERLARQVLADLEAKGTSSDLARLSLVSAVCAGRPEMDPLPLVGR